jgi:hypothetical protein
MNNINLTVEDVMDKQASEPVIKDGRKTLQDLVAMGCDFVVKGPVFMSVIGLVHNLITAAGENADDGDSKKMLTAFMDELIAGSRPTLPEQKEEEAKQETVETAE